MDAEQFTPAQLSFFAIYSPPLGPTDETFGDQVVFYYSRSARDGRTKAKATADEERLSENEKLRQIGLAQGMAGFARYSLLDHTEVCVLNMVKGTFPTASPLKPSRRTNRVSSCTSWRRTGGS
jgi:hypothetical protein